MSEITRSAGPGGSGGDTGGVSGRVSDAAIVAVGGAESTAVTEVGSGLLHAVVNMVTSSAHAFFTTRAETRMLKRSNQLPEMSKSGKIALSTGNYGMGKRRATRRSGRTIKHLTKEQLRAFFQAIPRENIRDRLLFNVMYLHALRRGEAAILTLDSFQDGMIHVTRLKGGRSLSYDMFPSTIKLLRRYLAMRREDGCAYLFRGLRRACAPLSGRTIDGLFRSYATVAGLPPALRHSHVLRHSLGTHLANEGVDIADAAEQLGHTDLNSTAIYFEITNRRRAKIHRRMLRSTEIVRT